MTASLLRVENLHKEFTFNRGAYGPAAAASGPCPIHDINFEIGPGEIVALVGETGAGKSTLTRVVALLARPDKGKVIFEGRDLVKQGDGAMRAVRRRLQVLFSDPRAALNPASRVSEVMSEPLKVQRVGNAEQQLAAVKSALRQVGLNSLLLERRLTALSAGERQRVALARLLTLNPALIVCDDPTRTLTPLAAEQFFKLMVAVHQHSGPAFLWLVSEASAPMVAAFADRLGVLYQGRLVEIGQAAEVLGAPQHPYTRQLLAGQTQPPATPDPFFKGCPYHAHCPQVMNICRQRRPELSPTPTGQSAACFLYSPT